MRQTAFRALVLLSAWTEPLVPVLGLTVSGDRLAGLAAVVAAAAIGARGGLHWTSIHSALAGFAAIQVLAAAAAAARWPAGLKFASIYVLGFACFCVAAECTGTPRDARRGAGFWIGVGAVLGVVGGAIAFFANISQRHLWGAALAQAVANPDGARLGIFAARVTISEHNLYSSFLLVPFALA